MSNPWHHRTKLDFVELKTGAFIGTPAWLLLELYSYFQDPDPVVTQSSPPPTFPIISNLSDIWLPDISSQIRVLLLIDFSLTRRVSNLAAPASTDVALMERATELQGSVVAEESKAP